MLLRSTGRLLCPDTLTANIPMLSNMPHLTTPCSGGGCMHAHRIFNFRVKQSALGRWH